MAESMKEKLRRQTTERLVPPIEHVKEIPGESKIGYYNFATGLVEKLSAKHIKAIEEENQENPSTEEGRADK